MGGFNPAHFYTSGATIIARTREWIPPILLTAAAAWIALSRSNPAAASLDDLSVLHLLIGAAYACLLVFVLGARRLIALLRKRAPVRLPLAAVIYLAFLIPALLTALPLLGQSSPAPAETRLLDQTLALQIWLAALQGAALAILLAARELPLPQPAALPPGPNPLSAALLSTALLSGLGLWLLAMFSYQLVVRASGSSLAGPISTPATLLAALAVIGLPIVQAAFFRALLLPALCLRFGSRAGIIACAALSATLLCQPLLWVPAFLSTLGFNLLTARSGGMRVSIYAHAVYNLLALLVLPGLIF